MTSPSKGLWSPPNRRAQQEKPDQQALNVNPFEVFAEDEMDEEPEWQALLASEAIQDAAIEQHEDQSTMAETEEPPTPTTQDTVTREASHHEYHPEKTLGEEHNREHKEEGIEEDTTSAGNSHEETL